MLPAPRPFAPPWTIEELDAGVVALMPLPSPSLAALIGAMSLCLEAGNAQSAQMEVRRSSRTNNRDCIRCYVRPRQQLFAWAGVVQRPPGTHRRGRCRRGVLLLSGFSVAAHALTRLAQRDISLVAQSPKLRAGQKRQGLPTIHSWICCSAQSRLTIDRLSSRGA